MRVIPDGVVEALAGSTSGTRMQFNAWYGGKVVAADMPVTDYRLDFDSERAIVGQLSCTILDTQGDLSPWTISDILGVGGTKIQACLLHDGYTIPLAWQRVASNDADETWQIVSSRFVWVQNSSEITIDAKDMTLQVQLDRFLAAEPVPPGGTCMSEIRRLLRGNMDVVFSATVVDKSVPASVVYKEDRLAAVLDLVKALGAEARQTPGGQFEVYMPDTTSVYTAEGGIEGSFIRLRRSQKIEDFPNAVVSTNTAPDGTALFGYATQTSGEGAWDSEHGRVPNFHNANFAETQDQINSDARSMLDTIQRKRTVQIPLRLVFHPGLDVGDYITVNVPILTGQTEALAGRVRSISYSGGNGAPVAMDIVLTVANTDASRVARKIRTAVQFGRR